MTILEALEQASAKAWKGWTGAAEVAKRAGVSSPVAAARLKQLRKQGAADYCEGDWRITVKGRQDLEDARAM